jgi:hypothetical protein
MFLPRDTCCVAARSMSARGVPTRSSVARKCFGACLIGIACFSSRTKSACVTAPSDTLTSAEVESERAAVWRKKIESVCPHYKGEFAIFGLRKLFEFKIV